VRQLHVKNKPSGQLRLRLTQILPSELKESSFLGGHHHSSHKDSNATITPSDSRSTTPTPGSHGPSQLSSVTSGQNKHVSGASTPVAAPPPTARSGLLKIRLTSGKGLKLPDGGEYFRLPWIFHPSTDRSRFWIPVSVPEPIQRALNTHALAASMSTSANAMAMQAKRMSGVPSSNRDSIQRKQQWWLPYVVLEFDKNEVLIDALGGDLSAPVWMYSATL